MKAIGQYPAFLVVVLVICISETARLTNRNKRPYEDEVIFTPENQNRPITQSFISNTTYQDDALQYCKELINTQPEILPFDDMRYYTGKGGEKYVENWSVQNGYTVHQVVRLHAIGAVGEDSIWTQICVGMYDATSYTYSDKVSAGGRPIAWITTHTRPEQSIGFMKIKTRCWRTLKQFPDCNALFYPAPFVGNLPQFTKPPISEKFWHNFSTNAMEVSFNWIWKININLNKTIYDINIQPEWIYKMDFPFLNTLEITGNEWGSPKKLLKPLRYLEYLDLSNNRLENIPEGMLNNFPQLITLIIGQNNLTEFPKEIESLQRLRWLDLSYMTTGKPFAIHDEDIRNISKDLNTLKLENTLLQANISSFFSLPGLKFLNLNGSFKGSKEKIVNVPSTCNLQLLNLASDNMRELPFSEMASLTTLILHDNEFTSWDPNVLIENNLTALYLSNNLISNITENSFSNFNGLRNLSLSGNRITRITAETFRHNFQVRLLYLSDNNIEFISENSFWNLSALEEIYLSNNRLKDVPYFYNMRLQFLDLSFNTLTEFKLNSSHTFHVDLSYNSILSLEITEIQILNLSYNNLSVISPHMWKSISHVDEVDLGGNRFKCCLFGNNSFYTENLLNLGTKLPLTCSIKETSPKILLETFEYSESECIPAAYFPSSRAGAEVVIPLIVIAISVILVATLIYVYRFDLTYVKYLVKLKKLGSKNDENRYDTCHYDAFVCYSAKNFSWVHDRLLPALESPPFCYRLCVHDRDFVLGAAINENIVASLAKSRKVILVLSKDFIASKWCQWELEMASHKMFVEKRSSIVLLELEPLDRRHLPWHLQYLMARITYLQWPSDGDPGDDEVGDGETDLEAESRVCAIVLDIDTDGGTHNQRETGRNHRVSGNEAADNSRRQRRIRREETCLKRLREALGESLSQRAGSSTNNCPPRSVLESS